MNPKHSFQGLEFILVLLGLYCYCYPVAFGANAASDSTFHDPQVGLQDWIFQMINIYPVWQQGYSGKGIRVRINDIGIDASHDEFQGRFDLDSSCRLYQAQYNDDTKEIDQHGTSVASVLGGAGNNDQCGTGIAPSVTISSCVVIGNNPDSTSTDNTVLAYKLENVDISQNAYGFYNCPRGRLFQGGFPESSCPFTYFPEKTVIGGTVYDYPHPCDECEFPSSSETLSISCNLAIRRHCLYHFLAERHVCTDLIPELSRGGQCTFFSQLENTTISLEQGATLGRNGKGIVYVFASGNGALGDTNFGGRLQSRFGILVGAVGRDSMQAQYSRGGVSLFLVAPAGDFDSNGTQPVAQAGGGCTDAGPGTSFASATVSGVIALILEANPDLTWRDVQGILALSSQPVVHKDFVDETETVNGAGLFHSNSHGFGVVNALAAVTAAQSWESYGQEMHISHSAFNLNLPIGDDPSDPTTVEFEVESSGLVVENVVVSLYLQHLSRGHLKITLTSPNGTVSTLTPGSRPENGQLLEDEPWQLRTVRSWGETAEGTWKLSIADMEEGDVSNCIDYADFTISVLNNIFDCAFLEYFPSFYENDFPELVSKLFDQGAADACCACDGGTTAEGNCIDMDGFEALCNSADILEVCVDGKLAVEYVALQVEDERGRKAQDACCVLGGGIVFDDKSSFQNRLNGWELDIYGHGSGITSSPTLLDSDPPSYKPSSSPLSTTEPPKRPTTAPSTPEQTDPPMESSSSAMLLLKRFVPIAVPVLSVAASLL